MTCAKLWPDQIISFWDLGYELIKHLWNGLEESYFTSHAYPCNKISRKLKYMWTMISFHKLHSNLLDACTTDQMSHPANGYRYNDFIYQLLQSLSWTHSIYQRNWHCKIRYPTPPTYQYFLTFIILKYVANFFCTNNHWCLIQVILHLVETMTSTENKN